MQALWEMEPSPGTATLWSAPGLHLLWAVFIIQKLHLSIGKMGLACNSLKMGRYEKPHLLGKRASIPATLPHLGHGVSPMSPMALMVVVEGLRWEPCHCPL